MRYTQGYGSMGGMSGAGLKDELRNVFNKPDNGLMQIIVINLIVFVVLIIMRVILTLSGGAGLYVGFMSWLMLPASVSVFLTRPWTLVTYFFLHEGFFHILFNMYGLYIFGRIIKEYLGGSKVVSLYVLGGIAGGIFYILIYNTIPHFADRVAGSVMLGASAGVYAIVVGAATFLPNYSLHLIFFGPVRIKYLALIFILLAYAGTIESNAGGDLAHLGGAAMGFFYIKQLQNGTDLGKWLHLFLAFVKSFFVRQPKVRVTYRKTKTKKASSSRSKTTSTRSTQSTTTSQDEIDAILDKISQSGYESLTKEEKQKLFNASKN